MTIDSKTYHPKWSLIIRLIRFRRANNRCECCKVRNGIVIRKEDSLPPGDGEYSMYSSLLKAGYSKADAMAKMAWTTVVLKVAHLDQDKTNNAFSNLAALCQKCFKNQLRCDHNLIWKGNNHNQDLYVCPKCGLEKWVG